MMMVKHFICLCLIFYTTSGFSDLIKVGPVRPTWIVDWFRGKKPFNSKLTEVSTRFHSSAYLNGIDVGFLPSINIERLVVSELSSIASNGDIIEHFSHRGGLRSPLIQSQRLICKPGTAIEGLHVAAGEYILGIEVICKPLEEFLVEIDKQQDRIRKVCQQCLIEKRHSLATFGQSDAFFLPNWKLLSSQGNGRKSILHQRHKTKSTQETKINVVHDLICPAGTVGIGLFGEHGNCIDAIGLVCSSVPLKHIKADLEMKALEQKEREQRLHAEKASLPSKENKVRGLTISRIPSQEEATAMIESSTPRINSHPEEIIPVTINGEELRMSRGQFRILAYIVMGIAGGMSGTQMTMEQPSQLLIITYAILGVLIGVLSGDVYANINDCFLTLSSSARKFDGTIESITDIIEEVKSEIPVLRDIAEVKISKAVLALSNSRLSLEQKINHISNQFALKTEESRALVTTVGEALKSNATKAARFITFGNEKN